MMSFDLSGQTTRMRIKQTPGWDREVLLQSPWFEPLQPIISRLEGHGFPTLQECNDLLAACHPPITVCSGLPLHFVAQEKAKQGFEAQYEPRCYLKGEVQTRAHNWHDLFNALAWLTYPKSKAVVNACHYLMLQEQEKASAGHKGRGAVRDMNTLFDESGVLVACADEELSGLLRDFQWKELFWRQRERVRAAMVFYVFGHGLYEKALQPYVGITGKGLVLAVEPAFFRWPLARRLAHLDGLLADYLLAPQHCRSTQELTPVPLLGVPGWSIDNERAAYYDNTDYFRPGRRR